MLERRDLAAMLLRDAAPDLDRMPTAELHEGAEFFGGELLKASALDGEAWQQRYEDLADEFAGKVSGYADDLNAGDLSPAEFRRQMEGSIRAYYTRAYRMGAAVMNDGTTYLRDADHAAIGAQVSDELSYLRGFVRDIRGGISADMIAARADMYADGIRSVYWHGWLSRGDTEQLYDYVAQPGACQECEDAANGGPYALEDCPVPGEVCEGYSRCRCGIQPHDSSKGVRADLEKYCAQPARGDGGRFTGCLVGGGTGGTTKPGGGRSGAGATNFGVNGTKAGEIGEHISETITRPLIERYFGGSYTRISHAMVGGHAGSRTTPWDGRVGKHAFDIKTISSLAKSQKAAIKGEEIARKLADARKNGWSSNIILQRIDHSAGRVDLYLLKGDTKAGYIPSKSWKSSAAIHLGGEKINVSSYFKVAA